MPGGKQPRKRMTYRQAQLAAAAEAARRRRRRRRWTAAGAAVALVAVAAFVVLRGGKDKTDVETVAPTTTSAPDQAATGSAAGKPCVPVAQPLPPGAPQVPVEVGPPPAQLVTRDLKVGTGAEARASSTVTVNYVGVACSTGKMFDSSYLKGQPATFPLSGVIKGWQDGVPGMKVGGQRLLGIPPAMGYGATGSPPDIAPDETLWFVIELLDAKDG